MSDTKHTRERAQLQRVIDRSIVQIEKSVQEKIYTGLKIDYEYLNEKIQTLFLLDKTIQSTMLESDPFDEHAYELEYEQCEKYRIKWLQIKAMLNSCNLDEQGKKSFQSTNSHQSTLKLPKIEMRKFDDNPRNWVAFWSQFKKIHQDENLDEEDKFLYLIQCMEVGSNSRNLVESYPPSKENYQIVLDQLKSRFAKDEILIEVYVRDLLKLVVSKNSFSLDYLYDKIIANLQTLETLGVVKDKYECILFPLIESALPESTLMSWSRTQPQGDEAKLTRLLTFLRNEVEADERLKLAKTDFTGRAGSSKGGISTASCLITKEIKQVKGNTSSNNEGKAIICYFCDKAHNSVECNKVSQLSLQEKKECVRKRGGCYICLKKGHLAKHCKASVKCMSCEKRHLVILCPSLHKSSQAEQIEQTEVVNNFSGLNVTTLLQTLIVKISNGKNKVKKVRALLDSGSQRSYIKSGLAEELDLEIIGNENLGHSLFGGIKRKPQMHRVIKFQVSDLNNMYKNTMSALEQNILCNNLPRVMDPCILNNLRGKGIVLTDAKENVSEISILIGSDILGSILKVGMIHITDSLVAVETKLGWTIQGPIHGLSNSMVNTHLITMEQDDSLEFIWNVETLGIKDPYDQQMEMSQNEILKCFNDNVTVDNSGRYEVSLIWKLGCPDLESNYGQAYKRLQSTTRKLENIGYKEIYHELFQEWIREGIIEKVHNDNNKLGHYLPHHAVIKLENITTKVRPVFDASSKDKNGNSLNSCIEKGPNLIELIPKLLILFRAGAYGVISDIKKAFLQIAVCPSDRDYLKLLWWNDPISKDKVVTFRHRRVPFGVACSPFLLAATINYHLEQFDTHLATTKQLKESYYVDNCITSFNKKEEVQSFIKEATEVMAEGKFELRGWLTNTNEECNPISVLGLLWDRYKDELFCHINVRNLQDDITKRDLLSVIQALFDPVGFLSPVSLVPKLITQKVWMLNIGWDDKIPEDLKTEVLDWVNSIKNVNDCKFSRCLTIAPLMECDVSVHVFSDASKDSYAGCVFLRTQYQGQVMVQLVMAKSRVAPIKRQMSLPRLELMGAVVASRLYKQVIDSGLLKMCKEYKSYCWTDSSVVWSWIKRQDTWKIFVSNRVNEICKNTKKEDWLHLPGTYNPADLPSRGCTMKKLLEEKWWLGPSWLRQDIENWPQSNISNLEINEVVINSEQKLNTAINLDVNIEEFSSQLLYFSKYSKIVRVVARLLRMNTKIRKMFSINSEHIVNDEYIHAEEILIRLIQKEYYGDKNNIEKKLITINDKDILRVKTRLEFSGEDRDFIYPILLPGKHEIVKRLVQEKHIKLNHAGTLIMMTTLRNNYWITGIRRLSNKIVSQCIICKRFTAKHYTAPQPPLPYERMSCSAAFEVTGIDLAGPLILKNNQKSWFVLFTCATFRAVHLELVESLSTPSFIMAFRRFIARRGRVNIVYTDNGTNFVGTDNLLKDIDWNEVEATTVCEKIKWRFSPPSAPWWGGWWERLVKVVKDLIRRILGKSCIDYIELSTILCDCEAVINNRPLTYVEMGEMKPLTPMMFLQGLPSNDVPDLDTIDHKKLNVRYKYLQQLREDFRKRFKSEYLALLISKGKEQKREPKIGDIVLIETEEKRLNWPLGIIKEVFIGKDGCTRVAKVQTATSDKVRAYQRLYPLEISYVSDELLSSIPNSNKPDKVKQNDFFKFQICEDCLYNLQASCQFKKKCRTSDKIYNKYMSIRDNNLDFHDFVKNSELRSFHNGSLKKYIEKSNEEVASASPSNSITNFMNAMDEDIVPTEESIINEVILEDVDILDESLDSHWFQDDQCFDIDFRFTPMLSTRIPTKIDSIKHCYVPNLDTFSKAISTMKMGKRRKSCCIDRNLKKALIRNKDQCYVEDLLRSPSETQSIIAPEENNERDQILQEIRSELESMSNINSKPRVPVKNLKIMKDLLMKAKDDLHFTENNITSKDNGNDNKENNEVITDDDASCKSEFKEEISRNRKFNGNAMSNKDNYNDNAISNNEDYNGDAMSNNDNYNSDAMPNNEYCNGDAILNNENYNNDTISNIENYNNDTISNNENYNIDTMSNNDNYNGHAMSNKSEKENLNNELDHNGDDISNKYIQYESETSNSSDNMSSKSIQSEPEVYSASEALVNSISSQSIRIEIEPIQMKSVIYPHVLKTPWDCKLCDMKSFSHESALKKHYAKEHNIDLTVKIIPPKIKCIISNNKDKKTPNEDKNANGNNCTKDNEKNNITEEENTIDAIKPLNIEFYTHYPSQPWKCKHCDLSLNHNKNKKIFEAHYATEHKRTLIIKIKYKIVCPVCGKISTHPTNGKRHLATHENDGAEFICSICELKYNKRSSLLKHIRVHEYKTMKKRKKKNAEQYPYACPKCSYTSKYNQNLQTHIRRHNKQYTAFCDVCSNGFYTKDALRRHIRVHTGDKPFACTHCAAKFTRCESLNLHIRTHTGERPYYCDKCSSSFSSRNELIGHKKKCYRHTLSQKTRLRTSNRKED